MNAQPSIIPVLNYHGVQSREGEYPWEDCERPYVLDRGAFESHLIRLRELGFETGVSRNLENWSGASAHKRILLTFDDGHKSHYEHVLPLLEKYRMKGIFFVSAGLVDKPGYMSAAELRGLLAAGNEIGSHGYRHVPLHGLSEASLSQEIDDSKKALSEISGAAILSFSIPRGYFTTAAQRRVKKAGYRFLYTSHFGINRPDALDFFYIKRMALTASDDMEDFLRLTEGRLGVRQASETAKEYLRRVLGPSFYDQAAHLKAKLLLASGKGGAM